MASKDENQNVPAIDAPEGANKEDSKQEQSEEVKANTNAGTDGDAKADGDANADADADAADGNAENPDGDKPAEKEEAEANNDGDKSEEKDEEKQEDTSEQNKDSTGGDAAPKESEESDPQPVEKTESPDDAGNDNKSNNIHDGGDDHDGEDDKSPDAGAVKPDDVAVHAQEQEENKPENPPKSASIPRTLKGWRWEQFATVHSEAKVESQDLPLYFLEGDDEEKEGNGLPPITSWCLMIHGLGDHALNPTHLKAAVAFRKAGIRSFIYNQQGHGDATGLKGFISDYQTLIHDAVKAVKRIFTLTEHNEHYRLLPYFLLGSSLGGAVAIKASVALVERGEPHFCGSIFLSAAIRPAILPNACVLCCLRVCCVPCCPQHVCTCLQNSASECWREEKVKREKLADEKGWGELPPRFATGDESLKLTEWISDNYAAINYPFLVIHGDADQICDIQGSRNLEQLAATRGNDKDHFWVEDGYHDLISDTRDGPKVLGKCVEWIQERLALYKSDDNMVQAPQ